VNRLLTLMNAADEELAAADLVANILTHLSAAAGLGEQVLVGVADAKLGRSSLVITATHSPPWRSTTTSGVT
jgi:hypothetical protein